MTELLSTGLVTQQKQHEAGIASRLLSALIQLCSVRASMLALDLANLSKSFYSNCQLDKKKQETAFFSHRERGKMEKNDKDDERGGQKQ